MLKFDLWSCLVVIFVIYVATLFHKFMMKLQYFRERNVPFRRSLGLWPLVTKQMSLDEFFIDLYKEFPTAKYSGAFDFGNLVYLIRDPEIIKSLTLKNFDYFQDHKSFVDESMDPLFGGNLFAMKGDRWKEMRAIMSPAFTSSKMRDMFELIAKCSADFTEYLEKQPEPLTIEMKDAFTRYTNDVIATTAFGISVNSSEDRDNEFYLMRKDATNFGGLRAIKLFMFRFSPTLMKLLNQNMLSEKTSDFFRDLVKTTVETREERGIVRPDIIHLLMLARHEGTDEKLSIDEITAQAFMFFLAGFEMSTTLMCFTCHELAVNPEIQERLSKEINEAFDEGKGHMSYEKLHDLKYLDMVLNEALRYYPPGAFTDRLTTRKFELPPIDTGTRPILVEPGVAIWIPIIALHRDPKYFPDPDKFDPERFSPENKENIQPFTFVPFGAGPRNCPGNRFALTVAKLALINVLRKFKIKPCDKTRIPLELIKGTPSMTSAHGFWLTLEPRNQDP